MSMDVTTCYNPNQSLAFQQTRMQNLIWDGLRGGVFDVPDATHEEAAPVTLGKRAFRTGEADSYLSCTPERFTPLPHLGPGCWYFPVVRHEKGWNPIMIKTVKGASELASRWRVIEMLKAVRDKQREPDMGGNRPSDPPADPQPQEPIPVKVFSTTPDPQRPALKPVRPPAHTMPDLTIDTHAPKQVAVPGEGFRPRSTMKT